MEDREVELSTLGRGVLKSERKKEWEQSSEKEVVVALARMKHGKATGLIDERVEIIGEEQCSFGHGRGCVDQIIALR